MSGFDPGDRRDDEVSFGRAGSPWWSPQRRSVAWLVGLTCGLLGGALIGAAIVGAGERPGTDATSEPTVVAGTVEKLSSGVANGPRFTLQLRNGGDQAVELSGLRFSDLDGALVELPQDAPLQPGVWRSVIVGAEVDCSFTVPRTVESVLLTLRTPEGEREHEIPLPGGGRSLLEHYAVECAPQVAPRPRDVVGLWVVEEALGMPDWVGIMVLRFGRDGSFVADPAGLALRDAEHGAEGRYSLEDGALRVDIGGGYGCSRGDSVTWRPSMVVGPGTASPDEQPRMTIAWVGGECPGEMEGQIWTLRRILADEELRSAPGSALLAIRARD